MSGIPGLEAALAHADGMRRNFGRSKARPAPQEGQQGQQEEKDDSFADGDRRLQLTSTYLPDKKPHSNSALRLPPPPPSSSSSSSLLSDKSKSFLFSHLRKCEEAFERIADLLSITATFVNLIVSTQREGGRFSIEEGKGRRRDSRGAKYSRDHHHYNRHLGEMEEDTSLAFAAGLGLGTHTQFEINDDAGAGGLGGGVDSEMLSNAIAQSAEVGVLTQARTSAILNSILIPDDIVSTIIVLKSGDNSNTSSGGGGGGGKRRGMTCVTDALKLVMMISEAVGEVKSAQTLIEESMAIEAGDKGCATQ